MAVVFADSWKRLLDAPTSGRVRHQPVMHNAEDPDTDRRIGVYLGTALRNIRWLTAPMGVIISDANASTMRCVEILDSGNRVACDVLIAAQTVRGLQSEQTFRSEFV